MTKNMPAPAKKAIRIFFDASVLFAAAYSATGAARALLRLAAAGDVEALVSQDVLMETRRNLQRKSPEDLSVFEVLLHEAVLQIQPDPAREDVWAAEEYVTQKDAPIIAAAINTRPDFLVTFDRKHLIDPPEVSARSGLKIVLPEIALDAVRQQSGRQL